MRPNSRSLVCGLALNWRFFESPHLFAHFAFVRDLVANQPAGQPSRPEPAAKKEKPVGDRVQHAAASGFAVRSALT
jgi:hypothetical protein